jgi:glyoxylate/hydroxypyruvate reductase A
MTLMFVTSWNPNGEYGRTWQQRLRDRDPGIDLRVYPDTMGAPEDIDACLVWAPPDGLMASLPNLKVVMSLGMGVDHIFQDERYPADVPVCRVVDNDLIERMSEWCVHSVLHYHRDGDKYDADQANCVWNPMPHMHATERRVGVMGLGAIGADTARKLKALNFDVAGWSRSPKDLPGIESFYGEDQIDAFLGRSDYVICLLPLTPETEDILNARAFDAMPKGGVVFNAARGAHVVDGDLIAALGSGQLSYAKLDVFREEPLPEDLPFWRHPKIRVTPHNAGITNPDTAVEQILDNYHRARDGQPLVNVVDPARGY